MTAREAFQKNLSMLIHRTGKNPKTISVEMNIPYTTLVDWANGKNFPRAKGIELLANYFRVPKSRLFDENAFDNFTILTDHEQSVITAYRDQPEKQPHVDDYLGVEPTIRPLPSPDTQTINAAAQGGGGTPLEPVSIQEVDQSQRKITSTFE